MKKEGFFFPLSLSLAVDVRTIDGLEAATWSLFVPAGGRQHLLTGGVGEVCVCVSPVFLFTCMRKRDKN